MEGHFLITIINLLIEGFTNDLDLLKKAYKAMSSSPFKGGLKDAF